MASQALEMDSPRKALGIATTLNMSDSIDRNEIAALAYELWQERGCPLGSPDEDWFRAEEKLKSSTAQAAAA